MIMEYKLGELAEIGRGSSPRPIADQRYFDGGNIPWIKIADATVSGKYIYETKEHVNEFGASYSRKLKPGTLIIAASGTLGFPKFLGCDGCIHDGWMYFSDIKEDIIDRDYLYYYLITLREYFNNLSYGAAIQNINTPIVKATKIQIPSLTAQKKIASLLSYYDDLIENNLARISLLEKMASELYKEWFVRFRFPGHEAAKFVDGVPEGWEMRKLKELIEFDPLIRMKKGVEYRTIPMDLLSTDSMLIDTSGCEKTTSTSGAHFQNGDTLLARITPCLENGKTGFVNTLDDGETAVGSTEFIVMRSKLLSPHLVYFIARSEYFRKTAINSMNGADGRQRAKISKLQSLSYPLPTRDIIDEFSEIVEPFFEEIKNLNIQNHNLTKQRDLLLPRLMSGKLSVEPLLADTA